MWDFEDVGDWWTRADPAGIAPIVAVPTTAGTGSEVGRAGVITNLATHTKKVIFHPRMLPAQVDPRPRADRRPAAGDHRRHRHGRASPIASRPTRSPFYHPMAEGIAVEGMRLVKDYLPRAYRDGTDLEARGQMLVAAAMGATAFQKGLGAIHALSHPVGAIYGTHHGLTNAVFMPYVLDFNREALWDKIDRLAAWLGIDGGFAGFLDFVLRLRRDLGIPHTLDRIGVDDARFAELAAMAVLDPTAGGNPRAPDRSRRPRPLPARLRRPPRLIASPCTGRHPASSDTRSGAGGGRAASSSATEPATSSPESIWRCLPSRRSSRSASFPTTDSPAATST